VVIALINKFVYFGESQSGRELYKITLYLPTVLYFKFGIDIFDKMSIAQMTDFKEKLEKLKDDLIEVREEIDELEQYKKLNKIFGDDFEIPEAKRTAKKQFDYIPSSSTSGMG